MLLAAAADPTLSPTADASECAETTAPEPLPPPRSLCDRVADLVRALVPDPTLTDLLDAVLADDALPRLLRLLPEADR